MAGKTMVEKILGRAAGREVVPGDFVVVPVDLVFAHTIERQYQAYQQIGRVNGVFDPEKVVFDIGHHLFSPATVEDADMLKRERELSRQLGVKYLYDLGSGIGHYLVVENGHIWPGAIAVGADSHTTAYGVLGAFASPTNYEITEILLSGRTWFKVPPTIRIQLEGQLPPATCARDVCQFLLGEIGADGALWKAVDFGGSFLYSLSLQQRMIFSLLSLEMGAMAGMMEPDEPTISYVKQRVKRPFDPVYHDPDAEFEKTLTYSVSGMTPMVACPYSPTNTKPIEQVAGITIHQAYIGGCTGGGIEDLRMAARILRGRRAHPEVRLVIVPGTRSIWLEAEEEGLLRVFHDAGASIYPPYCGPCQMLCVGQLAEGEVMLGTNPRNWPGRGGPGQNQQVYLASPYTAAASAVTGSLADPREFLT